MAEDSQLRSAGAEPDAQDAPSWPASASASEDAPVDAALAALARVPELPVAEHAAVYTEIHAKLLAELDADPGTHLPPPGRGA